MFYGIIGHIEIWDKLIVICITVFLMTSYANHQYLCHYGPTVNVGVDEVGKT